MCALGVFWCAYYMHLNITCHALCVCVCVRARVYVCELHTRIFTCALHALFTTVYSLKHSTQAVPHIPHISNFISPPGFSSLPPARGRKVKSRGVRVCSAMPWADTTSGPKRASFEEWFRCGLAGSSASCSANSCCVLCEHASVYVSSIRPHKSASA